MLKLISYLLLFLGIDLIPRDKKLVIYKECFKMIQGTKDITQIGYCFCLRNMLLKHSNLPYEKIYKRVFLYKFLYFPELYIYRPFKNEDKGFWWDRYNKEIRLKYLDKVIKYLTKLEL